MPNKYSKETQIDISKESFLSLMKEIYDDAEEQKTTALDYMDKFSKNMVDNDEKAMLGKHINDQQKSYEGATKIKLDVLKLQADILFSKQKKNELEESSKYGDSSTPLDEDKKTEILSKRGTADITFDFENE